MRAFDRWHALRWHEQALTLEAAALTVVAVIRIRVQARRGCCDRPLRRRGAPRSMRRAFARP
ncbi:MAG: hypothetical protein ACRD1V_07630 [Vicinamibacterales bacterium]